MTAWANLLIPAGAGALDGLVTGGFAVLTQVITHRSTDARERAARLDTFKIKRFETEQETLLTLQDTIAELQTMYLYFAAGMNEDDPTATFDIYAKLRDVMKLANRALSVDAAKLVIDYGAMVTRAIAGEGQEQPSIDEVQDVWAKAMVRVGAAIRRDPFTGEGPKLQDES